MSIGHSTTNSDLADALQSIFEDDDLFFLLNPEQQEAINEAHQRIRELGDDKAEGVTDKASLSEREQFDEWLFNCPVSHDQLEDQAGECTITFRYTEKDVSDE